MDEIQKNTQEFLKTLKDASRFIDTTQKEKTQKDFALNLEREDFKSDFMGNGHIKKVTYNNEKSETPLRITLYNGFVFGCLSEIYRADFNAIRNELKTTSEYIALNRFVSVELNKNTNAILKRL